MPKFGVFLCLVNVTNNFEYLDILS